MTHRRRHLSAIFRSVMELERLAHELEVVTQIATDQNNSCNVIKHYIQKIPTLQERIIEKYKLILSELSIIEGPTTDIARTAMQAILKNCRLDDMSRGHAAIEK
jgi:hypothetical protein